MSFSTEQINGLIKKHFNLKLQENRLVFVSNTSGKISATLIDRRIVFHWNSRGEIMSWNESFLSIAALSPKEKLEKRKEAFKAISKELSLIGIRAEDFKEPL